MISNCDLCVKPTSKKNTQVVCVAGTRSSILSVYRMIVSDVFGHSILLSSHRKPSLIYGKKYICDELHGPFSVWSLLK